MRSIALAGLALGLVVQPVAASARNIVLANDDGLSSNVVALYKALKADGHDVIVSVPCRNQSGKGGALNVMEPLKALDKDCRNQSALAGEPGAGPMTRKDLPAKDFYYVDGTPAMAMLYGVDVVAAKRWDAKPDIVLSGPNEGQNVGSIILSSGTVNAAQYASMRGIPAIALSAGMKTVDDKALANPESAKVAKLSADFVSRLDKRAGKGPMLPAGIALNVNFPDKLEGATWRASQIGTYDAYGLRFFDNVSAAASPEMKAMAKAHGVNLPELPGLAVEMNKAEPSAEQQNDESIVYRGAISVSPMRAGFAPEGSGWTDWVNKAVLGN